MDSNIKEPVFTTFEPRMNIHFSQNLLGPREKEQELIDFYQEIPPFIDSFMEMTDKTKYDLINKFKSFVELISDIDSIKFFLKILGIFANIRPKNRKIIPELYFFIVDANSDKKYEIINSIIEKVELNIIFSLCYDFSDFPSFFDPQQPLTPKINSIKRELFRRDMILSHDTLFF